MVWLQVYLLEFPAELRRFLESLDLIININFLHLVPLECLGLNGYRDELIVTALAPPAICFLIIGTRHSFCRGNGCRDIPVISHTPHLSCSSSALSAQTFCAEGLTISALRRAQSSPFAVASAVLMRCGPARTAA